MDDDRIVISSGITLTPESVANHSFGTSFRGCDPSEVRSFLKRVADEMAAAAAREGDLRQSLQEALSRAAHPHLDEDTLTSALGEHAARLLTNAREAATNIVSEAETRAARIIGDAEGRISRVRAEADSLLARRSDEAERMTAGLRQAAEAEARALRERARAEAEAEVESARAQGREMVGEARSLRERMLADLTRRRRTAEVQIEQLRLGRQRLLEAYAVVRCTLEEATAQLGVAESEAVPVVETHEPQPIAGRHSQEPVEPVVPELAPSSSGAASRPPARNGTVPMAGARTQGAAGLSTIGVEGPAAGSPPPSPPNRSAEPPSPASGADPSSDPPRTSARSSNGGPTIAAPTVTPRRPVPTPSPDHPDSLSGSDATPLPVDELFARLRAAQEWVPPPTSVSAPPPPEAQAPEPARTATSTDLGDPVITAESALSRRDELLDTVEADLRRQLKRALQDEQNEVLDTLRRQRRPTAATVLPPVGEQTARVGAVAEPFLRRAADQGAIFAAGSSEGPSGGLRGAEPPDDPGEPPSGDAWAARQWAVELADDLVLPLRSRLEQAFDDTEEGDGVEVEAAPVADRLGGGYRQWKTTHVEQLARHHAVTAFSRGAYAATAGGTTQRWVVDDDGPCPDCEDNALAGGLGKGEPFPTGQVHPPAHPGCRCLLVPTGP